MPQTIALDALPGSWPALAAAFGWDGTWRDIYVVATTATDWNALFGLVADPPYRARFHRDGAAQPALPARFEAVAGEIAGHSLLIIFEIAGITLSIRFFAEDVIELDLDPRQVTAANFPPLADFLVRLSAVTAKPALLTAENWVSLAAGPLPLLAVDAAAGIATLAIEGTAR